MKDLPEISTHSPPIAECRSVLSASGESGARVWSEEYGDIYFSSENGLRESEHVYLGGNDLSERFLRLREKTFSVGELGFGTGLNFLATWRLWDSLASLSAGRESVLFYASCEHRPMSLRQISDALECWPELRPYASALLCAWPDRIAGFHRRWLTGPRGGRVALTLMYGDAERVWRQYQGPKVQAWYLDGFSPRLNPALWSDSLFRILARHSAAGTTFSTYSVSGSVLNSLSRAGFDFQKDSGFGTKRHMLKGVYRAGEASARKSYVETLESERPWFPFPVSAACREAARHALVVGGGVAGASAAAALARRGWSVELFERAPRICTRASGNPAGIVQPLITKVPDPLSRFSLSAFSYWRHLFESTDSVVSRGVLQLARTPDAQRRYQSALHTLPLFEETARWCEPSRASEFAGFRLERGGLFFPGGAVVEPAALVERWLRTFSERVRVRSGVGIETMRWVSTRSEWELLNSDGRPVALAPVVVLAGGSEIGRFEQTARLPLGQLKGQIAFLERGSSAVLPRVALSFGRYLIPSHSILGATHSRESYAEGELPDSSQNQSLLEDLHTLASGAGFWRLARPSSGRVSVRSVTPDSLPMVGPVPVYESYLDSCVDLRHGERHWKTQGVRMPAGAVIPGLYLLAGLGGRGLTSAPLCGELLASQIEGEAFPVELDLAERLHPARFWVRALRKRSGQDEKQNPPVSPHDAGLGPRLE